MAWEREKYFILLVAASSRWREETRLEIVEMTASLDTDCVAMVGEGQDGGVG